jgi:hypothetical protein
MKEYSNPNLHFCVVRAESAQSAGKLIASHIQQEFAGYDNYYTIGGIASEDGSDDLVCYDDPWSPFPLTTLDDIGVPKEGTYFARVIKWVRKSLPTPEKLQSGADMPLVNPNMFFECGLTTRGDVRNESPGEEQKQRDIAFLKMSL